MIIVITGLIAAVVGCCVGYVWGWSQGNMQARLDAGMVFRRFYAQQKDDAPKWTRP